MTTNCFSFPPTISRSIGGAVMASLLMILTMSLFVNHLHAEPGQGNGGDNKRPYDLRNIIDNGAYGLVKDGKLAVADNIDAPLIPASILKILTSLVALEQLGPEYRFKTDFFTDARNDLYIKGYGDPFLVSEEIDKIVLDLQKSGVTIVNNIYLDDSSYQLESIVDGSGDTLNPYDVISSALAVNFNTINIMVDENAMVRSAEPQTPLLPIMTRLGKLLPGGEHRINISRDPHDSLLLTGQLFRHFLQKNGIGGNGLTTLRKAPDLPPRLSYRSSKKLAELIEALLLYSNNYLANQIFLQCGAHKYGYPATWQKGRQAVLAYLREDNQFSLAAVNIQEGSGISRKNSLTVRAMLHILELFKPYANLLAGKDNLLLKSGTLTGVYAYAGYFNKNDHLDSFAIILNQEINRRDEILEIIKSTL